jgi:hypothetical protein
MAFFAAQWSWCTKIPLHTPLVRLVTIDPSVELIEREMLRFYV